MRSRTHAMVLGASGVAGLTVVLLWGVDRNPVAGLGGDESLSLPNSATGGGAPVLSLHAQTVVSWASTYETVGELTAASDVVIHGRVVAPGTVTVHGSVKEGTFRSVDSEFPVEVLSVAKGAVAPGDRLTAIQTGGATEQIIQTVEGDSPLAPGQEYLFFLTKDPGRDGYWMHGGPIGRLLVSDGKASSVSQVDAAARSVPDLGILNRDLADVLREVRDHAADPRPVLRP